MGRKQSPFSTSCQIVSSAPPTSVSSERLFSGAGKIYDLKRNRLAPERAEILLFIKNNLKLTGGKYAY